MDRIPFHFKSEAQRGWLVAVSADMRRRFGDDDIKRAFARVVGNDKGKLERIVQAITQLSQDEQEVKDGE